MKILLKIQKHANPFTYVIFKNNVLETKFILYKNEIILNY